MRLLVAGCSFSSGWGLESLELSWPNILAQRLGAQLENRAVESSTNPDIFLQALRDNKKYDIIVVQWTALGRITLSPSPINPSVIVSHPNKFFDVAIEGLSAQELTNFHKIMTLANGDWRHYFNLIYMIEILQADPRIVFVNGLLHWDQDFFNRHWSIPMQSPNQFIEDLLQINGFDNNVLAMRLFEIIEARDKINKRRWVNLTYNWFESRLDNVSNQDQHPGVQSQEFFSDQIYNFIKGASCLI